MLQFDPLRRTDPDFFEFEWREMIVTPRRGGRTYATNDIVRPLRPNGFYAVCTTAGHTAMREPVWPTTEGVTVQDGSITWTMQASPTLPTISAAVYTFTPTGPAQSNLSTSGTRTRVKFDATSVELGTYQCLAEITANGEDYSTLASIEVVD
jgi:hypothetical protein